MNGIFTYISYRFKPNVSKYTIHGAYGEEGWFNHFLLRVTVLRPKFVHGKGGIEGAHAR